MGMGAIAELFQYVFAASPTFKSAANVGFTITMKTRYYRAAEGKWYEHEECVQGPSKIKDLLMRYWPDKVVVRTVYRGQEIERASY